LSLDLGSHTLPIELRRAISREEINDLLIRRYEGEVHLVASDADLGRAMSDIRAERVLGFDTETRPAFRKGEHHLPCLVQVATARAVHVFPLQRMDFSAAIAEFLGAREIVKIGVSVAHDLRQLKLVFPFEAASVLDAGTIAQHCGLEQTGLRNLAALFLGFRIPKGNRTSNWAARRLSPAQLTYAATDAWVCRELFLRFRELGLLH
jgi:ribonuclease D